MNWALFFAALFEAFMKCRENQPREVLEARLLKRGIFAYRAVHRTVRQQGLPRRERAAATKEAWEDLCEMPDSELVELVEDAEGGYLASRAAPVVDSDAVGALR